MNDDVLDDTESLGRVSIAASAQSGLTRNTKDTSVDPGSSSEEESDSDDGMTVERHPDLPQGDHYEASLAGKDCEWVAGHDEASLRLFIANRNKLLALPGNRCAKQAADDWKKIIIDAINTDTREPKALLHVFELNTVSFKTKYSSDVSPILVVYWNKENIRWDFAQLSEALAQRLVGYPCANVDRPAWVAANRSAQVEETAESKAKKSEEPEV